MLDLEVEHVEEDWREVFIVFPRKTITNKLICLRKIYRRRIWLSDGFHSEPEYQYAELFDMIKENHEDDEY